MKTQIVRLEPHDDFISARDKMGWNQTGRILLVFPENSHILNRQLDLVLLQRHSNELGAQLSIITDDENAKYYARKVGIPVYNSIQKAQKSHWRFDRSNRRKIDTLRPPEEPHPDLEELRQAAHPETLKFLTYPGTRLAFFALGVLALLFIAAVLVPSADMHLLPEYQTQAVTINVQAKPDIDAVNYSGAVPARRLAVTVEGRDSAASSGLIHVPQEYAQGRVLFTNLTDQIIQIPVATVIRTLEEPAVRFATTKESQLSAGVGETVIISAQALQPGEDGNLEPDQLVAIESELGASMTATNPFPTWGGADSTLSSPTPYNREQLYQNLEAALQQTALEEMTRSIQAGDILFTQTITISQVIAQDYDPVDQLPSDHISLNLRLEYEALYASESDLENLAVYALDASLPDMFLPQPDTLKINIISLPATDQQGILHWTVQAQRQIKSIILPSQAINQSLGLSPEVALQKITASLPLRGEPLIEISPPWWPRLPVLPFRFKVTTE
jgi:hypothetical protein